MSDRIHILPKSKDSETKSNILQLSYSLVKIESGLVNKIFVHIAKHQLFFKIWIGHPWGILAEIMHYVVAPIFHADWEMMKWHEKSCIVASNVIIFFFLFLVFILIIQHIINISIYVPISFFPPGFREFNCPSLLPPDCHQNA